MELKPPGSPADAFLLIDTYLKENPNLLLQVWHSQNSKWYANLSSGPIMRGYIAGDDTLHNAIYKAIFRRMNTDDTSS